MNCSATLDSERAARESWDAVVIGAGPAGALAAHQLATRGRRTLLVERHSFPRFKVCGGCLNSPGVKLLEQCGLSPGLTCPYGPPLTGVDFFSSQGCLHFDLPGGITLERATFDANLVTEAVRAGAEFLPETSASIQPLRSEHFRHIRLQSTAGPESKPEVTAPVVLCADGSRRSSLRELAGGTPQVVRGSRVGAGTIVDSVSNDLPAGRIAMVVGDRGYVGLAHLPGDRMTLAAAFDPEVLTSGGRIADVVLKILRISSFSAELEHAAQTTNWVGTPPLTHRPSWVAAERVFVLGDAAGYVEPFTGEGMAQALMSAVAVIPLALNTRACWDVSLAHRWTSLHRRQLADHRQWICRMMATLLRSGWGRQFAYEVGRRFPVAAQFLIARLNRPPRNLQPLVAGART